MERLWSQVVPWVSVGWMQQRGFSVFALERRMAESVRSAVVCRSKGTVALGFPAFAFACDSALALSGHASYRAGRTASVGIWAHKTVRLHSHTFGTCERTHT